jgi:hypothetical protein
MINIPEIGELLLERDKLQAEDSEVSRSELRVVEFLIRARRGTIGEMELKPWQKEVCDYLYGLETPNRISGS